MLAHALLRTLCPCPAAAMVLDVGPWSMLADTDSSGWPFPRQHQSTALRATPRWTAAVRWKQPWDFHGSMAVAHSSHSTSSCISVLSQDYPTIPRGLMSLTFEQNLYNSSSFCAEKCQKISHKFLPVFPWNLSSSLGRWHSVNQPQGKDNSIIWW